MARKNYSDEFRRQAVDLYRSTPGATFRGMAADLGISRHTLQVWVHALDPAACEPTTTAAGSGARPGPVRAGSGQTTAPETELAVLRARVAELEAEKTTLAAERDILRQAAKYFAGETRW
jgi:transposase